MFDCRLSCRTCSLSPHLLFRESFCHMLYFYFSYFFTFQLQCPCVQRERERDSFSKMFLFSISRPSKRDAVVVPPVIHHQSGEKNSETAVKSFSMKCCCCCRIQYFTFSLFSVSLFSVWVSRTAASTVEKEKMVQKVTYLLFQSHILKQEMSCIRK